MTKDAGAQPFLDALQRARATSRANAVQLADLPAIPAEHLGVFLDASIIREGTPGTYYLTSADDRTSALSRPSQPYTPLRVALMMAVWLGAIAVPFFVWLIAR
jgi:hypothetical protein